MSDETKKFLTEEELVQIQNYKANRNQITFALGENRIQKESLLSTYRNVVSQEQDFYERRGGVEAYKLKTAESLLKNNPFTDLLYHFADRYDEYARYMNDNFGFSLDENEFNLDQSSFGAMDTSSDKLSLEIAKKIFATYDNNQSVQKFEELLGAQFTLPNLQDYAVEYKPKMNFITGKEMYTEDPAQLRFQDLPEGESFNLARHRKKQLDAGEEELIIPDDFE
jgi:hypothetical protein